MQDDADELEGLSLNPRELFGILWRRRATLIQVFVVGALLGSFITTGGTPTYRSRARISAAPPSYQFNIISSTDPFAGMASAMEGDTLTTQLQTLRSASFQAEAWKGAGIHDSLAPQPSVSVEVDPADNIISITAEGVDRDAVTRLANTMADMHVERLRERNEAGLRRSIQFLTEGKARAEKDVRLAERRLAAFGDRYRLSELKQEQDGLMRRKESLSARIADLGIAISGTRSDLDELKSRLAHSPKSQIIEQSVANPVQERLQQRLDELLVQRETAMVSHPESSAEVRQLDEQIAALRVRLQEQPLTRSLPILKATPEHKVLSEQADAAARILTRQSNERAVLGTQLALVDAALSTGGAISQGKEYEQARLTKARDNAQTSLDQFSSRLQDLQLRKVARVESAHVIERALRPVAAVPTNRTSKWLTAVVLALALSVAVVLLLELFDDRLVKAEDIQKLTDRPILVHVPLIEHEGSLLLTELPAHLAAGEVYRSLRFSIRLAMTEESFQQLLVTSPSEGEGKTLTAINLSIALALEGWRVVLVDADLRKPTVHRVLSLDGTSGLSEVLAGLIPVKSALQPSGVTGLEILPAGPVPPNPSELLGSPNFDRLTEELGRSCDLVIFDSAPCLPVTDPLVIAEHVGATILVVQSGRTRKEAIKQALGHLARVNTRLLGLVVNRVEKGQGSYGYYGRYGYGSYHSGTGNGGGGAVSSAPPEGHRRTPRPSRRAQRVRKK